jgi:hypothetical protein
MLHHSTCPHRMRTSPRLASPNHSEENCQTETAPRGGSRREVPPHSRSQEGWRRRPPATSSAALHRTVIRAANADRRPPIATGAVDQPAGGGTAAAVRAAVSPDAVGKALRRGVEPAVAHLPPHPPTHHPTHPPTHPPIKHTHQGTPPHLLQQGGRVADGWREARSCR